VVVADPAGGPVAGRPLAVAVEDDERHIAVDRLAAKVAGIGDAHRLLASRLRDDACVVTEIWPPTAF